jgi:N-methylhydantoinase B
MSAENVDPVLLAVLSNSLQGIVREMANGLLRSGRSSVLNSARDFSCSLLTAQNELLAAAEGIPVHVFGSGLLGRAMTQLHEDLSPGDAFLHNDPYNGNSHAADHAILVPIFLEGRHVLTAVAKAHQADCGNSLPTTYSPTAVDVYEEGALIFPCVRIQAAYTDVEDVIRMCRARIRVPDQWYGDYLAALGAVRLAERRIGELVERYGLTAFDAFVEEWFAYSERRMVAAIQGLPAQVLIGTTTHDAFPGIGPEGLELRAVITVEPARGAITVDLRDNPDNLANGLNLTEATATAAAVAGILGALPEQVPVNAGSFRRVAVMLREGCVVGIPRFPCSCSCSTTNMADRVQSAVLSAFADLGDGFGMAGGALGHPPYKGVISGLDPRTGKPFVNQLLLGAMGGPGAPHADGWPTYQRPVSDALVYMDSVEIDEQRYPLLVNERRLVMDTGGSGRRRGGQATQVTFMPRFGPITVSYSLDGRINPPRGVRGGHDAEPCWAWLEETDGSHVEAPAVASLTLGVGVRLTSRATGGAGYGDPLDREPARVLEDVLEQRISLRRAFEVYGVVLEEGHVDVSSTEHRRAVLRDTLRRDRR